MRKFLITIGSQVAFQYTLDRLIGGRTVRGTGVVVGESIVGTSNAYVIKPDDGSDCVHVRCTGVSRLEPTPYKERVLVAFDALADDVRADRRDELQRVRVAAKEAL